MRVSCCQTRAVFVSKVDVEAPQDAAHTLRMLLFFVFSFSARYFG